MQSMKMLGVECGAATLALALVMNLAAPATAQPPPGVQWRLVVEDQFEKSTLDEKIWSFGFGWGRNSGSFSEDNQPANLSFKDGMAILKAHAPGGKYSSAAINTRNKATRNHGYWEARLRITKHVPGCLPAFWQKRNDDKWPPEVDIMEFFGTEKRQAMTVHYKSNGTNRSSGGKADIGDATQWHVYGVEYDGKAVRWWTNGKMVREIKKAELPDFFTAWEEGEHYSMLNIHMTDKYGWLGNVDKSKLPVEMHVDYFRIYERGATTTIETKAPAPEAGRRLVSIRGDAEQIPMPDVLGRLRAAAARPSLDVVLPQR